MPIQITSELFPRYETFSGQATVSSFQEERRRMETHQARTIQASMWHSQWRRLFWSKLVLCWLSGFLVLFLLGWHSMYCSTTSLSTTTTTAVRVVGLSWDSDSAHSLLRYGQLDKKNGDGFHPFRHVFLNSKRLANNDQLPSEEQTEETHAVKPQVKFAVPLSLPAKSYPMSRYSQERQRLEHQYVGYEEPQAGDWDGSSGYTENDFYAGGAGQPWDTASFTYHPKQGMEDRDNAIRAQRQQQQQEMTRPKNPAMYGWIPDAFPNPIYNPIRCAIAYLPQFVNHSDNENDENGMSFLQPWEQQQAGYHALRLCDPDWVLGGKYLEQVALAMNDFTKSFGKEHYEQVLIQKQATAAAASGNHMAQVGSSSDRIVPWVDLAIATARKMDLTAVLRDSSYYAYEDDDDMVNDASQLFAHRLHDAWWPSTAVTPGDNAGGQEPPAAGIDDGLVAAEHGVLIFLSVQDRVCFISTGPAVSSVLPWWRLDHIVTAMKPALRERDYGAALLMTISHLGAMLRKGPPSFSDRMHDFTARFGMVILFASFTFFFGVWGEYRDRRKRFQFAEERSQLKGVDKEKAWLLQQGYKTTQCPICLEPFLSDKASFESDRGGGGGEVDCDVDTVFSGGTEAETKTNDAKSPKPGTLDSYGMALLGADGKRIKILRCGHIFCESCWKAWVNSGCGNPCNCPVCRQDIGKSPRPPSTRRIAHNSGGHNQNRHSSHTTATSAATAALAAGALGDRAGLMPPLVSVVSSSRRSLRNNFWETHPSYDSVSQSRRSSPSDIARNNSSSLESARNSMGSDSEGGDSERQLLLPRNSNET